MLDKLFNLNALAFIVKVDQLLEVLVTTLIFVVIGLIFFGIAFLILGKITPFSIRKEIEDDQNTALGIVIGSMLIGIAIIIAAAIQG
jgi:putative membrane protein